MIRIALVEDDPLYIKQLREYLERYENDSGHKFLISQFTDGDEIAIGYKASYDIILMDVEMRFMDGMTAAQKIREKDSSVVIIFITNLPQYAIRGYAVDALDYVLKPISYFAFSQRIDRALERMERRTRKYIYVNNREGGQKLDQARITYVEVQGRRLLFHTLDGTVATQYTLHEAEELLDEKMFFRCNKGYLVNLEQVSGIQDDNAIVGGEQVQISRSKKKAFWDALNNYINEVSK